VIAAGPRGRNQEGGGFAATHSRCAAALRPGDAPRRGYRAAPPASRLLRIAACCRAALRDGPAGAGLEHRSLCGPSGRKHGQAPACPSRIAARPHAGDGRSPLTREKREGTDVQVATEAKITRNDYEEVSTV
jgi:hypothetical protein